jgi:hypothetical protein
VTELRSRRRLVTPGTGPRTSILDFLHLVRWLDGRPILPTIEPYRRQILSEVLDTWDGDHVRYNLALLGRGKKNAKSLDLVLAALFACLANDSIHGNECYIVATDEGQAADDLDLTKKLVMASPHLSARLRIRDKMITRTDGKGFITILPGQDVAGTHGKTYKFYGLDEIHTQRDWSLLEALALDPHRADSQLWITSYASIYHKAGVPLFDLLAQGKRGADPRMYLSWYAADFTTDPAFASLDPESRANPSRASFEPGYLAQQQRRLPAHVYRRLHLNLPGLPEGSAFTAESIMEAVARGVTIRHPEYGIQYYGFVDMSGGSHDDAVLGIAYEDADGRSVLARLLDQGPPAPFDPRKAVERFVPVLKEYGITQVVGDKYAGETFLHDFLRHGISYEVCALPAHKLYEALEPSLNAHEIVLLDHPECESQFLGLVWRGGKIDHPPGGEKDDFANAATGALLLARQGPVIDTTMTDEEAWALQRLLRHPGEITGLDPSEIGGNFLGPPFPL